MSDSQDIALLYGKEFFGRPDSGNHEFNRERLINLHIPKTAGTTLRAQLIEHYPLVPLDDVAMIPQDKTYELAFDRVLSGMDEEMTAKNRYLLSGHSRYRELASGLTNALPLSSVIVFLRNPNKRIMSDYFYSLSPTHPTAQEFKDKYPTFEYYLTRPMQINKQLQFLMPSDTASVAETIDNIHRKFYFVGITEKYSDCEETLFKMLGIEPPEKLHLNKNINRSQIEEIGDKYEDQMREIQAKEWELYDHFDGTWNKFLEENKSALKG